MVRSFGQIVIAWEVRVQLSHVDIDVNLMPCSRIPSLLFVLRISALVSFNLFEFKVIHVKSLREEKSMITFLSKAPA